MAIVRVMHVALGVRDLDRALAFYRDALGFEVVGEDAYDAARVRRVLGADAHDVAAVLLRCDRFLLQLLHGATATATLPSPPIAHLAVGVDDLASTLHSLRDRGVVIEEHTLTDHAPGVRSCVVRDPDGLAILLCQAPAGASSAWDDPDAG